MADTLPTLLAGPILRRVDRDRVLLWLATSVPLDGVTARISLMVASPGATAKATPLDVETTVETVTCGQRLFVSVVAVQRPGDATFPQDVLLGYDLTLRIKGSDWTLDKILRDTGWATRGLADISYAAFPQPTFFIPGPWGQPLNLLHGSCRKMHGGGEDALAAADEVLEVVSANTFRVQIEIRPSVLFLTGDQIYSDDVPDGVIDHIASLAVALVGSEDLVPGYAPYPALYTRADVTAHYRRRGTDGLELPVEPANGDEANDIVQKTRPLELFQPRYVTDPRSYRPAAYRPSLLAGLRREFVQAHAGFTTQDKNHLLTFGEFAAMYLMSWSPASWPSREPSDPDVRRFRQTLHRVARLLANVPTYMGFDDHDVTDDWNLDKRWYRQVSISVAGRRIVANALAAFWLFQGWGNRPENFPEGFRANVTSYLDEVREQQGRPSAKTATAFEDALWAFHGWMFSTPTTPIAVFLDTRTSRAYADELPAYDDQKVRAAGLMDRAQIRRLNKVVKGSGHQAGDPLILVSPAPLYGYLPAEAVQEDLLIPGKVLGKEAGRYAWDIESWRANRLSFFTFLTFIAEVLQPRFCVVLSGDVHYAFTTRALYTQRYRFWVGNADEPYSRLLRVPFLQLTSSSLKNETSVTRTYIGPGLGQYERLYPEIEGLSLALLLKHRSPRRPSLVVASSAVHVQKPKGFAPPGKTPVMGVINVGRVTIHGKGNGYPGVTHTLFTKSEGRLRENSVTMSTGNL